MSASCNSGSTRLIVIILIMVMLVLCLFDTQPCATSTTLTPETFRQEVADPALLRQVEDSYHSSKEPPLNLTKTKFIRKSPGLDFFLHDAFLDTRYESTIIRIFGMTQKESNFNGLRCEFTLSTGNYSYSTHVDAKLVLIDTGWPYWGPYYAARIDCDLQTRHEPAVVRLTTLSNQNFFDEIPLQKTFSKQPKGSVAACVKPAFGEWENHRIIEWMETMLAVGIEHIYLYDKSISGPWKFVLDYYVTLGVLTLVPFPYSQLVVDHIEFPNFTPGKQEHVYQQGFLLALNDCLYRFHGSYEHLVVIDIDEIILPVDDITMTTLMANLKKKYPETTAYSFSTAWHFSENQQPASSAIIPPYLYMQRHPVGSIPTPMYQPKSVIVAERTISVNFHSAIVGRPGYGLNYIIPWHIDGYICHYRGPCSKKFNEDDCNILLNQTQPNPILPRYLKMLDERVSLVLDHTGTKTVRLPT